MGGLARLAYSRAQRAGIEVEPLLRRAGLTEQQIEDSGARLPVQHQIQFLNVAANALEDEFLGFHLAQLPDLRELGLLFYVAASSETLGSALQRAARYSSIANEGLSLTCLMEGEIRMVFEYVGVARHSDRHQIEFLMSMVIRLCRELTGERLTPSRVRINHRRSNQEIPHWPHALAATSRLGQGRDEVTFVERTGDKAIRSADPYLNELLRRIASRRFLIDAQTAERFEWR